MNILLMLLAIAQCGPNGCITPGRTVIGPTAYAMPAERRMLCRRNGDLSSPNGDLLGPNGSASRHAHEFRHQPELLVYRHGRRAFRVVRRAGTSELRSTAHVRHGTGLYGRNGLRAVRRAIRRVWRRPVIRTCLGPPAAPAVFRADPPCYPPLTDERPNG